MTDKPYSTIPNSFKADLAAGKTLIGCWQSFNSPYTAELLGMAGFDWVLFDAEHSPSDLATFVPQLMAFKGSPTAPIVRPPWLDTVTIKKLLDVGFFNFLIPVIESGDAAREAVAATRYPPRGVRGVGTSHRSNMYGTVPDYFKHIDDSITVLLQIETQEGVDAVDEIASVDGVDGIFIGPSDLSAALGHIGNPGHPDVWKAVEHIHARARAHGKAVGTLMTNPADAQRAIDMGMQFVAVGSDQGVFRAGTLALRRQFKKD